MTAEGKTRKEIAKALGIGHRTLRTWLSVHRDLKEAVSEAMASRFAVETVEHSLLRSAVGYSVKETRAHFDSETGEWQTIDLVKNYPPNVAAIQFMLKNMDPNKWKDKQIFGMDEEHETVENVREAAAILKSDPVLAGGDVIDVESRTTGEADHTGADI